MRRALLHRVHERSPAFNHATYAEIKYSTARTPGPTAPRPRDPQLWMEMDRCVATSRYPPLSNVRISMKIIPPIEFFEPRLS